MTLNNLIKKSALEAMEQGKPAAVVYGIVTSLSPFKAIVEQKLPLNRNFFINTRMLDRTIFEIGDKLVLLRVQGGQKYLYIDKLVSE